MNKNEFSEELHRLLSGLPWADVVSSVEFYEEMIHDGMEEGLTEEEAVAKIGTPAEIAARIRAEVPVAPATQAEVKGLRKKRSPLVLALLILGFPVWGVLLISCVAVAVSLFAVAISLLVSLWAVFLSLAGAAFVWVLAAAVSVGAGGLPAAGMLLGMALFCGGLCILSFFLCRLITKKSFVFTKNSVKKILGYIKGRRCEG